MNISTSLAYVFIILWFLVLLDGQNDIEKQLEEIKQIMIEDYDRKFQLYRRTE